MHSSGAGDDSCRVFPYNRINFKEKPRLISWQWNGKLIFLKELCGRSPMLDDHHNDHKKEEWQKLCEKAAVEQDPDKLVAMTREICRLLDERRKRLETSSS